MTKEIIQTFATRFCRALSIPINPAIIPIDSSQAGVVVPRLGIYVCKETWDTKTHPGIDLFIDCVDRRGSGIEHTVKRYYHVTWAAMTYYIRECPYNLLLKPLKELCIPESKSKFCDYMFRNRTYRNGVRRYEFYQLLNAKRGVDHVQTEQRFTRNMFSDAVLQHRPYRFSIAFENDIVNGWVTEKIVNSFLAGSIPIYEGTDDVYKYFNRDAFINAKDFDTLNDLADYVMRVDDDQELYQKYIDAAPSSIEKLRALFWWETLKSKTDSSSVGVL